jgi:hypothetical protein
MLILVHLIAMGAILEKNTRRTPTRTLKRSSNASFATERYRMQYSAPPALSFAAKIASRNG